MIDFILTLHSASSPPAIFNRNKTRIPNLGVLRGGYCAFGGPYGMRSDHRQLCIEVDNSTIFGKHLPSSFSTPRFQLRSDDPRSRTKHIKMAHQEYSKNCVSITVRSIQELVHSLQEGNHSVQPTIIEAYDGFHQDTSKAGLAIESRLQSRYIRKVLWSPKLQRYREMIDFWQRIVQL